MGKDKHIVNLIFYAMKLGNMHIIQQEVKDIYDDISKCLNNRSLHIKRFSNSSIYILNNINQTFTEELIIQTYFLLTNELLENEIATKIMNYIIKILMLHLIHLLHYFICILQTILLRTI